MALVTGGGGAIGGAVCRALQADGARVAVVDLAGDAARTVAAGLADAVAVAADLTDRAQVDHAVAVAAERLGPVEILVNAAGWDEFAPFDETDEPFWRRVIDVNYTAMLRTCHAVVGPLERHPIGKG